MKKQFVCIVCPNGCELTADIVDDMPANIEGGLCCRGREYVENEVLHPVRTIATSVRVLGGEMPLVSLRLDRAIPKKDIFPLMEQLKRIRLTAPVRIGQVVLADVLQTGANVIATKNIACIED